MWNLPEFSRFPATVPKAPEDYPVSACFATFSHLHNITQIQNDFLAIIFKVHNILCKIV
jgi:hypothetical protein